MRHVSQTPGNELIAQALRHARRAIDDGNPAAAIGSLLPMRERFTRSADACSAATLLGTAFAAVRDFAAADAQFDRARTLLDRRSRTQTATLEVARGWRYVLESRIGDAWRCYESSLVDKSAEGRIESERVKAAIHHAEGRFGEEAGSLMRLLELIGSHRQMHERAWHTALNALAQLAYELPAPDAAAFVAQALAGTHEWPARFERDRFYTLRALAWCHALAGNTLGFLRVLREAAAVAEEQRSAPLRAIVLRDRSVFARYANEEHWCANELASALDIVRNIDWTHVEQCERAALSLVAEALAPSDPDGAAALLARYSALVPELPGPIEGAIYGVVHIANGRPNEGLRELRQAYAAFVRTGFEWRAGKAAVALAAATGEERWRLLALDHLEPYKHSWLYASALALAANAENESMSLTPMQERVFNMICEGLSTDAIAARLGRSHSTVRNHIKLIFKAMGVRSRAALVAKAARTGSFPAS
jgi:DNA-binding CsgD family transcriptional regulator